VDKLFIDRVITSTEGTFGVLSIEIIFSKEKKPFAITLEREWLNNQRGVSCIPAGNYMCLRCNTSPEYNFKDSPRFGDTFVVTDVDGRQYILFHSGNIDDDTHGCILVAEQYGSLHDSTAILSSRQGFGELMSLMKGKNEFELQILNHFL
jgi:hypothetical protein